MGNISSRSHSVPSTPNKSLGAKALTRSEGISNLPQLNAIDPLDPRSPNIDRTPMTVVMATERRIKQILQSSAEDNDATPTTPANTMRRRLLRDLGYNYSEKELNLLDPRSPSAFIPRTPIALAAADDEGDSLNEAKAVSDADTSQSFEYTECIEDASCRYFSEKISNITLDGWDGEEASGDTNVPHDKRKKYLETNFDVNEAIAEAAEEEELDPRSPSLNVHRTPIVLANMPDMPDMPKAIVEIENVVTSEDADENIDNSLLDIIEPAFSSTPTSVTAIATPSRKANAIETKQKNLIYEDDINENNVKKAADEFIPMTPVQKFQQRDGEKRVRTPLSVINRRTKSAENLSTKQSRIRAVDENNKLQENNLIGKKNANENTPKSSMIPLRMPLSQRNSVSKIPQLKRREV